MEHEKGRQAETDSKKTAGDHRKPPDAAREKSRVKIKVMASNGDLNTARATAQKLSACGYSGARMDLVAKKYDGTRVYFADGFQDQAREIAAQLGGETVIVGPLTWKSIFHIIVVTDTVR